MDVTISENYSFKRISPQLYADLIYISKSAFNIDPGIRYYQRKNNTIEFGPRDLGFIAYSKEGEPAAFYGVYAYPMILNGVIYVSAQSGDTMTHKNHIGKGLFTHLAKMTYDLAKSNGVSFIFGFPNSNSYPGFVKKLDWICPNKLNEYKVKVATLPLCKLAKKIIFLKPIYKIFLSLVIKIFSQKGEVFPSSVIENGVGGVNRSLKFVDYKSFGGACLYKILKCNVWLKSDGFLFIGDIERKDEFDYSILFRKIKKICFYAGIDTIVFQTSIDSYLDKKFSEFLVAREAFYVGYLNLNNDCDPADFKYVFADVDTF